MLFVLLNLRPVVEKYYQDYKEELELDLLSYCDGDLIVIWISDHI
jgi:hypothetical protein